MQKLLFLSALLIASFIALAFATDVRAAAPDGRDGSAKAAVRSGAAEPDTGVQSIIAAAEQHLQRGESYFAAGNLDGARREFDIAVDSMIDSGIDVRSDTTLYARWREMIEKISRYQAAKPGAAEPGVATAGMATASSNPAAS